MKCYIIERSFITRHSQIVNNTVYQTEEDAIKAMILWTRFYNVKEKKRERRFVRFHEKLFHIPKDGEWEQLFIKTLELK